MTEFPYLELPLDLLELSEAEVVEKPVLQDLVGRGWVWVGQNVLDETERVLAERLDDSRFSSSKRASTWANQATGSATQNSGRRRVLLLLFSMTGPQ
jgi:hypothetical protein